MSIIAQLPVAEAPTNVYSSLTMDKRFGLIEDGKDLVKVPFLIQLEQVIRQVKNDPDADPVVEVHPSFFCEWEGKIHKCTGRRVPTGLELPGDKWLYTLANILGISADEVKNNSQLNKPWINIKEV